MRDGDVVSNAAFISAEDTVVKWNLAEPTGRELRM
jgi:hypothetical protein